MFKDWQMTIGFALFKQRLQDPISQSEGVEKLKVFWEVYNINHDTCSTLLLMIKSIYHTWRIRKSYLIQYFEKKHMLVSFVFSLFLICFIYITQYFPISAFVIHIDSRLLISIQKHLSICMEYTFKILF